MFWRLLSPLKDGVACITPGFGEYGELRRVPGKYKGIGRLLGALDWTLQFGGVVGGTEVAALYSKEKFMVF